MLRESNLGEEERAREFFNKMNVESSQMCYVSNVAEWRYASDITDENERLKV